MSKEYIVYRDTIIEALDHLDEFNTKMEKFITKNPNYSYSSDLDEVNGLWEVKVKVKKNEQTKIKTT